MEIVFLQSADEDLKYWVQTGNKQILKKIAQLTASMRETPFSGIGKPEHLKYGDSGKWSRRIT